MKEEEEPLMMMFSSEFKQGTTAAPLRFSRNFWTIGNTENMCTCRSYRRRTANAVTESGVMEHNLLWPLHRGEKPLNKPSNVKVSIIISLEFWIRLWTRANHNALNVPTSQTEAAQKYEPKYLHAKATGASLLLDLRKFEVTCTGKSRSLLATISH